MSRAAGRVQSAAAECVGTAFLVAAVVGSGIMGERLAGGNVAIALLANAIATGAGLAALILTFGPVSGAHFNPLVTAADVFLGRRPGREFVPYATAQLLGAVIGVVLAHALFELPLVQVSDHARGGPAQVGSEVLATFGLLATILSVGRTKPDAVPWAVGAYITAAYWFTSSTSFANPVVTLARALTDTFAGIEPENVVGFVFGQIIGASLAVPFVDWLYVSQEAS